MAAISDKIFGGGKKKNASAESNSASAFRGSDDISESHVDVGGRKKRPLWKRSNPDLLQKD